MELTDGKSGLSRWLGRGEDSGVYHGVLVEEVEYGPGEGPLTFGGIVKIKGT
jgi:hypothetical protein